MKALLGLHVVAPGWDVVNNRLSGMLVDTLTDIGVSLPDIGVRRFDIGVSFLDFYLNVFP